MANEKRLIDVQDAIKLLRGKCVAKYPNTFMMGLFAAADEIAQLPTVDAAPVVHGRWKKAHINGYLKCNHCEDAFIYADWLESGKWNYCPNCGAKMRGDSE